MQSKDIKVGEFYAYESYKGASRQRVRVLETGVGVQQGTYSWERRTIKGGVRVEFNSGTSKVVTTRQIKCTWAEQEVANEAARKAREQREEFSRKTAARRASAAKRLDDLLSAHGETRRTQTVFGAHNEAALKAVGFEFREEEGYRGATVQNPVSAIPDLNRWMTHGTLDEKSVGVLLADVEAGR